MSIQLQEIQNAIRSGYTRVGGHAIHEAAADLLLIAEVWAAVLGNSAAIIEDYPGDPRGPSCLIYGEINGTPLHVVVAYPSAGAAAQLGFPVLAFLITCYQPGGQKHAIKWSADFKKRLP